MRNLYTAWPIVDPQSPLQPGLALGQVEGKTRSLLGESTGPQSMWILRWSHPGETIRRDWAESAPRGFP